MIEIRAATKDDTQAIHQLCISAFPKEENQAVAQLAVELLDTKQNPGSLSFVAETRSGVVGHIAFSPLASDFGEEWLGFTLAPLSVLPEHQKSGLGSKLVNKGLTELRERAVDTVLVYGDPKYYGRFGFYAALAEQFEPPYQLTYPFGWQAKALSDRVFRKKTKVSCVKALQDPTLW